MEELLGTIKLFAGNFAPQGYFTCEGQTLPISQYTALFSILGTTYGGDGITTFKLPDLRGAFPTQCTNISGAHPGGTYSLGQVGGNQSTTITAANMPPHTHSIIKGSGSNISGSISVNTVLQASTGNGQNATPSNTNNALGTTVDANGGEAPKLYTNSAPSQNLNGISSTVNSNLNFDPTGLTLSPWGSGPVPIPTVPNFVAMQYIICWQGVYPTRP
ncbi:Probable phage Tail Collar domain protein [Flavobacterium indicum GPTSA100-9 = DSM 17447]|uniref:Probable phage Tail Collar domain protein n=1 Tax=Flavobacterium indicum (strain DSM 17447 / CIP 109464 / GPTSA100-9) TaxID=1094466 RepID=H8XVA2_FLAIG|nr:tail fiber protein [Flavobacterium indicum]CCG53072.1 Probable phage Tail Collar domain protein [Flavobacterium indicum GPTSA100-9 = DSM 17447]